MVFISFFPSFLSPFLIEPLRFLTTRPTEQRREPERLVLSRSSPRLEADTPAEARALPEIPTAGRRTRAGHRLHQSRSPAPDLCTQRSASSIRPSAGGWVW